MSNFTKPIRSFSQIPAFKIDGYTPPVEKVNYELPHGYNYVRIRKGCVAVTYHGKEFVRIKAITQLEEAIQGHKRGDILSLRVPDGYNVKKNKGMWDLYKGSEYITSLMRKKDCLEYIRDHLALSK
jgi:hypothetical protein